MSETSPLKNRKNHNANIKQKDDFPSDIVGEKIGKVSSEEREEENLQNGHTNEIEEPEKPISLITMLMYGVQLFLAYRLIIWLLFSKSTFIRVQNRFFHI